MIYYYDKSLNKYDSKPTTKSLFSEDYANTRIDNDEFDHKTLEEELNNYFEKDFEKHAKNIVQLAEDQQLALKIALAIEQRLPRLSFSRIKRCYNHLMLFRRLFKGIFFGFRTLFVP